MQINTQFDKGKIVYTIHNNKIMRLPIISLKWDEIVWYSLLVKKAFEPSLGDKDEVIERRESECFISIDELALFWNNLVVL